MILILFLVLRSPLRSWYQSQLRSGHKCGLHVVGWSAPHSFILNIQVHRKHELAPLGPSGPSALALAPRVFLGFRGVYRLPYNKIVGFCDKNVKGTSAHTQGPQGSQSA